MYIRQRSTVSFVPDLRRLAVSLAATAAVTAAAVAAPPAAAQSADATPAGVNAQIAYDEQTLQSFAAAAARVLALRSHYYPRVRAAEIAGSQEKADRLFDEMRARMTAAIRDSGFSEAQYRAISGAAKTDENLRRRINAILQGVPPAQEQVRNVAPVAPRAPSPTAAPAATAAPPPDDGARERLEQKLAKATEERERHQAEQAALRDQMEKLERELAAVKTQEAARHQRLSQQKEQALAERKKAEAELDNLLGEVTRLRGELATLQSRDTTLREQLEAQRVRADAAQINKEARLAAFRHEIKRLAGRLAAAQDALAAMSSQLQSNPHTDRRPAPFEVLQPLERRSTSLDRVLANAGPDFALRQELDGEIARRERERQAREAERAALQQEIAGLNRELSNTYQAMAELIGEPAAQTAAVTNLDIDDGIYTLDVSQETAQLFEMGPPQLQPAPPDSQGEILLDEPDTLGVGDTVDQPGPAGAGDGAALDAGATAPLRINPAPAAQIAKTTVAALATEADTVKADDPATASAAPSGGDQPLHQIVRDREAFTPASAAAADPPNAPATVARDFDDTVAGGAAAYRAGEFARAHEIWSAHAEAGNRKAQFHLGALYFEGRGTDADLATAYFWLQVSAYQGYKRAGGLLASVAEKLPSAEVRASQARARKWLERRAIEVTQSEQHSNNSL